LPQLGGVRPFSGEDGAAHNNGSSAAVFCLQLHRGGRTKVNDDIPSLPSFCDLHGRGQACRCGESGQRYSCFPNNSEAVRLAALRCCLRSMERADELEDCVIICGFEQFLKSGRVLLHIRLLIHWCAFGNTEPPTITHHRQRSAPKTTRKSAQRAMPSSLRRHPHQECRSNCLQNFIRSGSASEQNKSQTRATRAQIVEGRLLHVGRALPVSVVTKVFSGQIGVRC